MKLSGDGTRIDKRLNVINFTFTILDKASAAYSAEGTIPLLSRKIQNDESLTDIKSLGDNRFKVESLKSIEIGKQDYKIPYLFRWRLEISSSCNWY